LGEFGNHRLSLITVSPALNVNVSGQSQEVCALPQRQSDCCAIQGCPMNAGRA
jgi:hypothetical protein